MHEHDTDIGVVGAGPAGAWAARQLAAGGMRVALFDASHPREKACGGGITGRALDEIAAAVPAETLDGVAVEDASFHAGVGDEASVDLRPRGASRRRLLVVDRRSFDAALLEAAIRAGAEHIRERVTDVLVGSDGVRLQTNRRSYRCSRVIGADGVNSLVRRRTAGPLARADLSIATGYFVFGETSRDVRVEFVSAPPGYFWSFPRRDHLAVGACAQADAARVGPLAALVTERIRDAVRPGRQLVRYSWPIPSLGPASLAREQPAGDRWFLAGDAAGLVDPITREGIFFALRSASLAAEAILGVADAPTRYASALRREIYPELSRAARLKRGFFSGPFTRLLVEALRQSQPVREVMADLVAGEQPYQTLKRRLLATLEVRLAWRLLLLEMGVAR